MTDEPELWGAKGDAQLTIDVRVTALNWTGLAVILTLPDGNVMEVTTSDTTAGERTYTYTVTNLFIEDAGVYSFYTFQNGLVTSALQNVTLYREYSCELIHKESLFHTIIDEAVVASGAFML